MQFEPTLWDLKLAFGQTDQQISAVTVVQHTAITLSWPEAKVLAYFLNAHVASHESQIGRIVILPNVVGPPSDATPPGATLEDQAKWKKAYEAMNKIYRAFIKENPESAPSNAK